MKKNKSTCPYRDKNNCRHKDRQLNKRGHKRNCGYKLSPESCPLFLDWVEVIDMEYLEKESILEPINPSLNDIQDLT